MTRISSNIIPRVHYVLHFSLLREQNEDIEIRIGKTQDLLDTTSETSWTQSWTRVYSQNTPRRARVGVYLLPLLPGRGRLSQPGGKPFRLSSPSPS